MNIKTLGSFASYGLSLIVFALVTLTITCALGPNFGAAFAVLALCHVIGLWAVRIKKSSAPS